MTELAREKNSSKLQILKLGDPRKAREDLEEKTAEGGQTVEASEREGESTEEWEEEGQRREGRRERLTIEWEHECHASWIIPL